MIAVKELATTSTSIPLRHVRKVDHGDATAGSYIGEIEAVNVSRKKNMNRLNSTHSKMMQMINFIRVFR